MSHPDFASFCDLAAGREAPGVREHAQDCADCARRLEVARRLVETGRRAAAAEIPARALRRAAALFRGARRPLWRILLDSALVPGPALALRGAEERFLRVEGPAVVEIRVRRGARGAEVHGQVTPADYAAEAALSGKTARVAADGTFVLRRLPPGAADLTLDGVVIVPLEL